MVISSQGSVEDLREQLRAARQGTEAAGKSMHEIEQRLRVATAVAWVGEVNRDDEGDVDGTVWPASPEVAGRDHTVRGGNIFLSYVSGAYNLTLTIDGGEQSFSFRDGSGRLTFRAFRDRVAATQWVQSKTGRLPRVKS